MKVFLKFNFGLYDADFNVDKFGFVADRLCRKSAKVCDYMIHHFIFAFPSVCLFHYWHGILKVGMEEEG